MGLNGNNVIISGSLTLTREFLFQFWGTCNLSLITHKQCNKRKSLICGKLPLTMTSFPLCRLNCITGFWPWFVSWRGNLFIVPLCLAILVLCLQYTTEITVYLGSVYHCCFHPQLLLSSVYLQIIYMRIYLSSHSFLYASEMETERRVGCVCLSRLSILV